MAKKKISAIIDYIKGLTTNIAMFMMIIAILLVLWISLVIISVYFLGLDNNWAGLTMDHWILVGIALILLFIIITLIQNLIPYFLSRTKVPKEKRKQQVYQGKRIYDFTFPFDSKGGIFSRTYISIDDKNLLNFRFQMIPPEELWKTKTPEN